MAHHLLKISFCRTEELRRFYSIYESEFLRARLHKFSPSIIIQQIIEQSKSSDKISV